MRSLIDSRRTRSVPVSNVLFPSASIRAPMRNSSLAVLAASALVGADARLAARALAQLRAAPGRGARVTLDVPGGAILLLDESYNANPASMRAALALLGQAALGQMKGPARNRRVAVLGDMLELGPSGRELHRGLADAVIANGVDLVFCCGPLMRDLWEALPTSRRGTYAPGSAELQPHVLAALGPDDIVMVKGSLGSRMGLIVKALENRARGELPARSTLRAPIMNG